MKPNSGALAKSKAWCSLRGQKRRLMYTASWQKLLALEAYTSTAMERPLKIQQHVLLSAFDVFGGWPRSAPMHASSSTALASSAEERPQPRTGGRQAAPHLRPAAREPGVLAA